jgi:hypothetical protein
VVVGGGGGTLVQSVDCSTTAAFIKCILFLFQKNCMKEDSIICMRLSYCLLTQRVKYYGL